MGKVLGINVAAVYLGHSLGPFIGGYLTQHYGWRSIFLISVFLGLIVNLLIVLKMKGEWREAKEEKFDLAGSILYSVTLLFIMYGFTQLSTRLGLWLILLGGLGIFIFMKWEIKVKSPVLDINLFKKNRVFAFSNLAAMINYSATYATTFLLSLYLQYIKGLSPETAGLVLICLPAIQSSFSTITGKLSDRIEPQIVASMGMSLITVGLFLFVFLTEKTSIGFIMINLVLLGIGYALFISPNIKAVMSSVENKLLGVASGTHGTMRANGMIFSMGITILVFSMYLGSVQITPDYYPLFLKCIRILFILFTGLCLGGMIVSLAGRKVR
jgi:MFS family permease